MTIPFVRCIGPATTTVPFTFEQGSGVVHKSEIGSHAIWAARVPFIPALDSEELKGTGQGRISKTVWRQFRFLYDLARVQEHSSTYELRFIAHPAENPAEPGEVQIVFLGKVFHSVRSQVEKAANRLWEKFASSYPLEDPFNYPLTPVVDAQEFAQLYAPILIEKLTSTNSIAEIRRFEEMPIEIFGTSPVTYGDYIVHPFVPTLDFSAMGRLFETLAVQRQKCFASISLRPISLFDRETFLINEMAARFYKAAQDDSEASSQYMRSRAKMGAQIYQALMQEREFLMQIKVQVVGLPAAPHSLIEALGSELMNNGRNPFPTKWVSVSPNNEEEFQIAKRNLELLEHDEWGKTLAHPELRRLRTIVDVQQAAGAFRLPIPPESGYMPGVLVKSEPFVSPQDHLELTDNEIERIGQISLGEIYHRGNATGRKFTVPIQSLTRHSLIAGSTGSGKSTTIMSMLTQLWGNTPPVPFLVLYPVDKPDYRRLLETEALKDDLLIFTVGDETAAPFRFNPLAVPNGVLLKTHLSRLMRVFSTVFDLFPPLPMIYREALRMVYGKKGWNVVTDRGGGDRQYPMMQDFHDAIIKVTDKLKYGGEVQDTVRQASVIRIADLLENAGHVLNVRESPAFDKLLQRPVVMELGRVGSQDDITLLMGFLLVTLTETLEQTQRAIPHITVVEEAHRLMSRSERSGTGSQGSGPASAGEDFANILAEVRGYNAGLLIAEQMPSQLVQSAIGNTFLKVMHWLEDSDSFGLFSDIMNLNDPQRSYTRRLKPGEAVVRSRFGRPVHIVVDSVLPEGQPKETFNDQWLMQHIPQRAQNAGIAIPDARPYQPNEGVTHEDSRVVAELIFHAPLGMACAFCRPLLATGRCLHQDTVDGMLKGDEGRKAAQEVYRAIHSEEGLQADQMRQIANEVAGLSDISVFDTVGVGYCFLAHVGKSVFSGQFSDEDRQSVARSLKRFPWNQGATPNVTAEN